MQMVQAVRILAALNQPDTGDKKLLSAAIELVTACADLIGVIESETIQVKTCNKS